MREIKFRAKQINDNNWISGYGVIIGDGFCAIPYTIRGNTHNWKLTTITCDINTLGQYTGLKDKNGKEIYEGDILYVKEFANMFLNLQFSFDEVKEFALADGKGNLLHEYKCVISFIDGNMIAKLIDAKLCDCDLYISALFGDMRYSQPIFEFEIIGNIHDNPELIKEEEK
jgi:uncharacterized phage protein (TIGR01671 family)